MIAVASDPEAHTAGFADIDELPRDDDRDPYGILDDVDFLENWNAETIPEALDTAENAPSSTDYTRMKRCQNCGSVRVIRKEGWTSSPVRKPGDWKCQTCEEHSHDTKPPLADCWGIDPDEFDWRPRELPNCDETGFIWCDSDDLEPLAPDDVDGDALRAVRETLGLSARDCEAAGIHNSTILRWERGQREPSSGALADVVVFLRSVAVAQSGGSSSLWETSASATEVDE